MKKLFPVIVFTIILAVSAALPGCTSFGSSMNGSGKIIDQDLKLANFDAINVHGPFELEIIQDNTFTAVLSTDENLISRVRGSLDRKTLILSVEAPATFYPTRLKVKITMPRISALSLSDKAKASLADFKSFYDFNLYVNKGSILTGFIEADDMTVNLSADSQANLAGKSTSLDLQCSGGSKLDLSNFTINKAQVKLKEASEAILNVTGELDVTMSEASKIYYVGNPLIADTSISGGSAMIRK
jgi:hypothetical protein